MRARLSARKRSDDMSRRLGDIASPVITRVGHGSARLYSTGPTTAGRFEPGGTGLLALCGVSLSQHIRHAKWPLEFRSALNSAVELCQ
jgi:hypothetical protein